MIRRLARRVEVVGLALLAYVPFLLSSPGKVSADTKAYLYLDPGRLLSRAPFMWDAHVGAGTVPHQNIGYLFPMGPYYWLMDQLHVPDWVAQRLWLGSITFAAGLGALWLLRMLGVRREAAIAGAVVFMLTPYQLAFTARISALLLPWAALPVLVGLTIRSARRGGWRDPVLFAFAVLAVGGTNAASLFLVGLAPVLWLVVAVVERRIVARAALLTAVRIGVATLGLSLWWAAGLSLQGRYGLPVLRLTETVRTTSSGSSPGELLRGLGNWFFSGGDRLGPWLDQSTAYFDERWLVATTFAVPILALGAAAVFRWRHRTYFVVLIVVGTLVGVGAWPYTDPSVVGELFSDFASNSAAGLALRNTARVVPLVVLGIAALIAAGVSAVRAPRVRMGAAAAVVVLVVVNFAPVWRHGYLSEHLDAPEDVPAYWEQAARAIDRGGDATRVLELPGADFAAYRWGNTVDPITPGLTDRPWVGRESLPAGTPPSVDLLAALDRRVQEGTLDPASVAPVARLLNAGDVLVRSDLEYERYLTPRPRRFWALLTDPRPVGLGVPQEFGPGRPNVAGPVRPLFDELELRTAPDAPWPPEVALFPVEDAVPIVHTSSVDAPVVLAGDAEGIVDAVEAGLLDGTELIRFSASLDRAELTQALRDRAALVLTDTNRRRARRWTALRDDTGPTERAGQVPLATDVDDYRLSVVPGTTDRDRTVAEHDGGTVDATSSGDRARYTPEDRAVHAFDGDVRTAWRVAGGAPAEGERIVLRTDDPVRTDRVTLVQPLQGPRDRWITRIALSLDDGEPITVDLGPASRTDAGQVVRFPEQSLRTVAIEVLATSAGDADPKGTSGVGFAEIRVDDVVVEEVVRLPVDLLDRAGVRAEGRPLAIVLSRLRGDPSRRDRQDEERALARRFTLPSPRTFALTGTVRVAPNASDVILDAVLGTAPPGTTFAASSHLAGDAGARASRAFDGDPTTSWTAAFGEQVGQWLEVDVATPVTIDTLDLAVVADGRHSVPTTVRIEADGQPARTVALPAIADGAPGATQDVSVAFEAVTASSLRFVVEAVRPAVTVDDRTGAGIALPVGIGELAVPGLPAPAGSGAPTGECRDDLLAVDARPVPVRVTGDPGSAGGELALESCAGALDLGAGSHEVRTASGLDGGLDVDRLVLRSDTPAGSMLVAPAEAAGSSVRVTDSGPTSFSLRIRTDGEPFWLVLGQSHSRGWEATASDGRTLGRPDLVDGYANGWRVPAGRAGTFDVELRWTPQGIVWWGIAASVLALLACIGVLVVTRRRRWDGADAAAVADPPARSDPVAWPAGVPGTGALVGCAVGVGAFAALVARPWMGLLVGGATVVAARVARGRVLLTAAAPAALAIAKVLDRPEVAWLAVLLPLADLVLGWWSARAGEPEHALSDDVLVDLGGAPGDRV